MSMSSRTLVLTSLLSVAFFVPACGDDSNEDAESAINNAPANNAPNNNPDNPNNNPNNPNNNPNNNHEAPHWGYDGEGSPERWGELNPEYAACDEGTEQSPVNIPQVYSAYLDLAPLYQPSPLKILNNGHTVQVNIEAGSTFELEGNTYELKQFHYHAHSEHALNGAHFPMELHLVHADANGNLAVLGIMVEEQLGASQPVLASIIPHLLPTSAPEVTIPEVTINPDDLLPEGQLSGWRYQGSLTTPPCSEGVEWTVLDTPIHASPEQIAAFTAIFDHNYRPVQDLHSRDIESPHWTYEGEEGPEGWADLSPGYASCDLGVEQTPVNVMEVDPTALNIDTSAWTEAEPLRLINNGHTVQINVNPGNITLLDGVPFELKQFHYHAHSEHTVDGEPFPLELHFVHADADSNLAVVGLFIVQSDLPSHLLDTLLPHLPTEHGPEVQIPDATLNLRAALAEAGSSDGWRYQGSLTTPPCSENVAWYVLAAPAEATFDQIEAFTALYDHNYRPLQDLHDRTINP